MTSTPVTVEAARSRAAKLVERDRRSWAAAGDGADAVCEIPLRPPNERAALADPRAAAEWASTWRGVTGDGVVVHWGVRSWPSMGRQQIPERVTLTGADAIARFAGRDIARDWVRLRDRARVLRDRLATSADQGGDPARARDEEEPVSALVDAIRRYGTAIDRLDEDDFALLLHVLSWLREHPASGYRLRQVPIPGMHSKWLGARRALVEGLHAAATGEQTLGLVPAPETLRVRFLDPSSRPGGLTDVTAPIEELAAMSIAPDIVFVFENLESVLALPDWPGVVAIHGGGYAVPVHTIRWAMRARVVYWGDLDADGFAILHRLRSHGVEASSVLMDEETLLAYRDLWVPDPGGVVRRVLPTLTPAEQRAVDRIADEGGVRLEQERIPWPAALDALRAATMGTGPGG